MVYDDEFCARKVGEQENRCGVRRNGCEEVIGSEHQRQLVSFRGDVHLVDCRSVMVLDA